MKLVVQRFSNGPKRECVSLPSPEDENRYSYTYLEFRTMKNVQKPINSVIYHRQDPLDSIDKLQNIIGL
jgi:hypothetical protein